MIVDNKLFQLIALSVCTALILSCGFLSSPAIEQTDPSLVETEIAIRVMSTSIANQQMTLQALQAQQTLQSTNLLPTASAQPLPSNEPMPPATQTIPPSPEPSKTNPPTPLPLVLDIQASFDTFYCYQPPYRLTITVTVSDINRGLAVYYHIEDKRTGVSSEGQVVDLHRKSGDIRDATIIGGGSSDQNLQFPPLMGESYFVYQIISDDGTYRSPVFSDITFFPCGQ